MQGIARRVTYVALYEGIAVIIASLSFQLGSGQDAATSAGTAVVISGLAVGWNFAFNWLFERWEARQTLRGRNLARRISHAVGFELGFGAMIIPLLSWMLSVSLWQALLMNIALMTFFSLYTFAFTWGFDRVFGLPETSV
ncbi:MAG: hypothetical protein CFE33_18615 [Pseudorhodobacter sp. PARRP1]|nr:MAG: hypothetical protein CFE33_18615 [Pseudorhodobacter sp. PARRP1]